TETTSSSKGLVVAFAVFAIAAHAPLLFSHFHQLWLKPHYQMFPLVLIGAFALLWPTGFSKGTFGGVMRPATIVLTIGIVLTVLGLNGDSLNVAGLGTAAVWGALGGVAIFASLPLLIFTGTSYPYASTSDAKQGMTWALASTLLLIVVVFFGSYPGVAFSA